MNNLNTNRVKSAVKRLISVGTILISGCFGLALPLQADDGQLTNPVIGNLGNDPEGAREGSLFTEYAVTLWQTAISLGALAVIGLYIVAAFEWITAGGESSKVESAQNRFKNATIGLIILVSSFAIVAFVGDIFFGTDFNILEITLPVPD